MKARALDRKKYAQLLIQVLPRPITTDNQHKLSLAVVSRLLGEKELSAEETALVKMLSLLISDYERRRYAGLLEKTTPSEALAYLMEENQLSQSDFPEIPQSRISDILTGKRKISKAQARVFGERFKVSPALFFD
jgi:HTH-type transcriptional regulator / antitoxin HigA